MGAEIRNPLPLLQKLRLRLVKKQELSRVLGSHPAYFPNSSEVADLNSEIIRLKKAIADVEDDPPPP